MLRVILGLLCLILLVTPASTQFNYITKGNSPNLVVFVHGFMGSPSTTFDAGAAEAWPRLIANDNERARFGPPLSSYGVGVVEYPTGVFARLRLEDIAERVRIDMLDAGVFYDYRNIHIIAHSMGGLVVKRMFNIEFARNKRQNEAIKSIFLISVPSRGADAADVLKKIPFFSPQFKDLGRIEANNYLNGLENDWQRNLRERTNSFPRVYCAYERKPLVGFYTPVPQAFAATSCDNTPRAEDEDHFTIVTPRTRKASMYRWVRGRIIETNEKLPQADLVRTSASSEKSEDPIGGEEPPPPSAPIAQRLQSCLPHDISRLSGAIAASLQKRCRSNCASLRFDQIYESIWPHIANRNMQCRAKIFAALRLEPSMTCSMRIMVHALQNGTGKNKTSTVNFAKARMKYGSLSECFKQ